MFCQYSAGNRIAGYENHLQYIGTLRKNKAEIPREFLTVKTREVYSTLFGHTKKKKKKKTLLS